MTAHPFRVRGFPNPVGFASKRYGARTRGTVAATVAALAWAVVLADVVHAQDVPAWRLSQQPVFSVGEIDGPPETMFSRIAGAVRLPDGRFAVADGAELRITVYDAGGRLQHVFGREGEGPGEFGSIRGLWSAGGDTLAVWDSNLRRITRFRPDGTVVRTVLPAYDADMPSVAGLRLDGFAGTLSGGGVALAWIAGGRPRPDGLSPDRMAFGSFDNDGSLRAFNGAGTGMLRIYRPGVGGGPYPFSPFPWAATVRDTVVYTDGLDGTLHFFGPDGGARTVTVDGPQRSLADGWRALDAALEESDAQPISRSIVRITDRSLGEVPRHARMFTDDAGRIWLKEFDPATDVVLLRRSPFVTGGRWTIVDTRGALVARLTMPPAVAPLAVHGDLMLGIARDELDVERFVVYRLIR
jgi:hypothetical protein